MGWGGWVLRRRVLGCLGRRGGVGGRVEGGVGVCRGVGRGGERGGGEDAHEGDWGAVRRGDRGAHEGGARQGSEGGGGGLHCEGLLGQHWGSEVGVVAVQGVRGRGRGISRWWRGEIGRCVHANEKYTWFFFIQVFFFFFFFFFRLTKVI